MPCWYTAFVYYSLSVAIQNPIKKKQVCSVWLGFNNPMLIPWDHCLPYLSNCSAVQSFVLGFCWGSVSNISGSTCAICPELPSGSSHSLLQSLCLLWSAAHVASGPGNRLRHWQACLLTCPGLQFPALPFLYLFSFKNHSPKEKPETSQTVSGSSRSMPEPFCLFPSLSDTLLVSVLPETCFPKVWGIYKSDSLHGALFLVIYKL